MRTFHSEYGYTYGRQYAFGYTTYAEYEAGDKPEDLYTQGFLPRSADPEEQRTFYMCRSVRVPTHNWQPTSENRRILKKLDGLFTYTTLARESLTNDTHLRDCFLAYFARQHGDNVMSPERLIGILTTPLPLVVTRLEHKGTPVAYVFEIVTDTFTHYWYSCWTEAYSDTSIGMWIMVDVVRRAVDASRTHAYLGTAYGAKGKYKTNLSPLEFWDGAHWNADEKLLARYIQEDHERTVPFVDRLASP